MPIKMCPRCKRVLQTAGKYCHFCSPRVALNDISTIYYTQLKQEAKEDRRLREQAKERVTGKEG